jgi:hypothetical protein
MRVTKAMMKAVQAKLASAGGKARARNMTPEQLRANASLAVSARWKTSPLKIAQRTAGIISDHKLGRSAAQIADKRHVCIATVYQTLQKFGMGRAK